MPPRFRVNSTNRADQRPTGSRRARTCCFRRLLRPDVFVRYTRGGNETSFRRNVRHVNINFVALLSPGTTRDTRPGPTDNAVCNAIMTPYHGRARSLNVENSPVRCAIVLCFVFVWLRSLTDAGRHPYVRFMSDDDET